MYEEARSLLAVMVGMRWSSGTFSKLVHEPFHLLAEGVGAPVKHLVVFAI
jgi:hypothetical protein